MRAFQFVCASIVSACASTLCASASVPERTTEDPIVGIWSGKASCAGDEAQLYLRFAEDATGQLTAMFDLPSTNVIGAPLGIVARTGDAYDVAVCHVELDAAHASLKGTFKYLDSEMRFEMKQVASAPVASKPRAATSSVRAVWTFDTKAAVWSSPAVNDGVVYIGSNDGRVYALNSKSGKRVWEFQTGGPVVARPTVVGHEIFVASDEGHLFKLDSKTGDETWRFDLHGESEKRDWPSKTSEEYDYLASGAALADGTVFVGSADGRMYAVDASTGTEKWTFETGKRVRSTPTVANGIVFFGSYDHFVYAVDAKSGALRWKYDAHLPVVSSPTVDGGTVYVGSRSASLYALDAPSGAEKWRHCYWLSWVESSGTVRDHTLYVGSSDYELLLALDTQNGRARWTFDTDGWAWSSPAVTDTTVFIGAAGAGKYTMDHRGGFCAVDRADGHEKWRVVMPEIAGSFAYGVASSPAVADGLVFFGGLDGKVYAFDAK